MAWDAWHAYWLLPETLGPIARAYYQTIAPDYRHVWYKSLKKLSWKFGDYLWGFQQPQWQRNDPWPQLVRRFPHPPFFCFCRSRNRQKVY
jgi:hypothetical protein